MQHNWAVPATEADSTAIPNFMAAEPEIMTDIPAVVMSSVRVVNDSIVDKVGNVLATAPVRGIISYINADSYPSIMAQDGRTTKMSVSPEEMQRPSSPQIRSALRP
jgi:hypothetical protein